MRAEDFRRMLAGIGVGQAQVARAFGYDKSTVSRWVRGLQPIPVSVLILLALVRSGRLRFEEIEQFAELLR